MNQLNSILVLLWLLVASQHTQAQSLTPFQNEQGKWGYQDTQGNVRIKARYQTSAYFRAGVAVVSRQGKFGVIDTNGKTVLRRKYDLVTILHAKQRIFKVRKAYKRKGKVERKYGVLTKGKRARIPIKYDRIWLASQRQPSLGFIVQRGQKYALFAENGRAVTGFDYDFIRPVDAVRVLAKKKQVKVYLGKAGKVVSPPTKLKKVSEVNGMELVNIHIPNDSLYQLKGIDKVYKGILKDDAQPLGGYAEFYKNLKGNLIYPERATQIGVEGRVFLRFVVELDGSISNIEVVKGIGSGCDEAAVQALKYSKTHWVPAKIKGQAVRYQRMVPITFRLR
jgi:TonB family protein